MLAEAIADFTPDILRSLGVQVGRERSRSRDQERTARNPDRAQGVSEPTGLKETETSNQESKSTTEGSGYIFFKARDRIRVLADAANGWWYGQLLKPQLTEQAGYFPSNYVQMVQPVTSEQPKQSELAEESQSDEEEDLQVYDDGEDYAEFAKKLVTKEQILIEHRAEQALKPQKTAPFMSREQQVTKEIIGSYKKFGVDNANPTRAIMRKLGVTADKATELINNYKEGGTNGKARRDPESLFDYEAWNDMMNKRPPSKSKPNAKRKKQHKVFKLSTH